MSTTVGHSDLRQRLRHIVDRFGSVAELSRAVGVTDNAVYKWLSGRGQPTLSNLVALAHVAHVSIEWLATGHEAGGPKKSNGQATNPEDYVFVPRYDVRITSGRNGNAIRSEQVVDYLAFKNDGVRTRLNTDPRNLLLIEAIGDSMTPTLEDSDLLLVDLGEPRFKHDGVYVIRRNSDLAVRRLQRRPDGKLLIISDNPAYTPVVVSAEGVRIIGRVIWAAGRL
jgi:phage repressor protein C with HTH and peptisase S24 domain